jgi:hypothetical protein
MEQSDTWSLEGIEVIAELSSNIEALDIIDGVLYATTVEGIAKIDLDKKERRPHDPR